MPDLCTRASAQQLLEAQTLDWGTEEIPLHQSHGRVLARALIADRDQPPFDRVAMDGIAVPYAAYAGGQRIFPRERTQTAGQAPLPLANPENCVEIMTGAALPPGCTTVVRYEDLVNRAGGYELPDGLEDRANIHYRGKDCRAGDVLAPAGSRIGIPAIGMLATCGYATVVVAKNPRIAVIATGDELVEVSEKPAPHQIRKSNLYQLAALLASRGYPAENHHLPDDRNVLLARLETILANHDVVLLSGGVSKGKFDFIPTVLEELGVRKLFHGVAQRPGKPLWAGRAGATMVFGLPGNPQSTLSCCLAYVLPFLDRQAGAPRPPTYAKLASDLTFNPDLTLFAYVETFSDPATGNLLARPVRHAGSGDAGSLLRGNGFLELPAGQDLYPAGGVYQVRLL